MTRPRPSWAAAALGIALLRPAPSRAEPPAPPPIVESMLEDKIGAALPLDSRFRSHDGTAVRLGDVLGNGRPALLTLAYNRCEMLCSLVLRGLADTLRETSWDPEQFSVVTLSIDPRDTIHEAARTRAVLLERSGIESPERGWSFLVGSTREIDAVASSVGFRYAWDPDTEQYAHPAVLFAISSSGELIGAFSALDPDRDGLRAALLGGSWSRRVESAILDCFRFDPASKRHGSWIALGLRGTATALVLSLFGLVGWLSRRRRWSQ